MGVQNAAKVLWTGKNIRPGELIHIYERVHKKKDKIRLDVDILNFYHDYADVHDTYNDVMKAVAKKLFIISSFGFRVTAIVDGLERPFCKRSSWDRKKQKLLDIHNSIYCQQTAKALASTMDPKTRSKTQMEEDRLRLQNSDADVDEKVHVALYQADSMIAYRVKNNLSDGYISEDTDFQILLGPAHFNIRGAVMRALVAICIVNQDDTNTLSKEILITLCEALLHEPVIVDESTNKYEYIFGEPTSLTEYVSYFKDENSSTTQILQAPPVNICSGIPGHSSEHTYLQAEKTFKCDECLRFFLSNLWIRQAETDSK